MKFFANLFLLAAIVSLVMAFVIRLFIPEGILSLGPNSFFGLSLFCLLVVIAISQIKQAFKD
jgi:FtsH-binding integral membrane protein